MFDIVTVLAIQHWGYWIRLFLACAQSMHLLHCRVCENSCVLQLLRARDV